jgi:hypothetical protein
LAKNGSREVRDVPHSTHHTIEDDMAMQLCSQLCDMHQRQQQQVIASQRRSTPTFEAPTWAVPAQGEARLEPVCDSIDRQPPVDLRERAVFRVGRSPQSDVQLLHATSSRRHAMLFHHANGSCYIVDCGSAHGTYVNGVRVSSPPSKGGTVVPHRVRRGAMIRFGGPGAPQFMLKSFAFDLEEMKEYPSESSSNPAFSPSPTRMGAVVQHNTRLNALGKTAKDSLIMSLTSKRSFDSMETVESDYEAKRIRCSSPPLFPEREPLRLVSPDLSGQPNKRRRVTFSDEPPRAFYPALISPDLSSDENENECEESI